VKEVSGMFKMVHHHDEYLSFLLAALTQIYKDLKRKTCPYWSKTCPYRSFSYLL